MILHRGSRWLCPSDLPGFNRTLYLTELENHVPAVHAT